MKTEKPKYWTKSVPFDKDGNMLTYGGYCFKEKDGIILEPFNDTLELHDSHRGRSAAHFIMKSTLTGKTYPMFMHLFFAMIKKSLMVNGVTAGVWAPVKRGANYSIALLSTL